MNNKNDQKKSFFRMLRTQQENKRKLQAKTKSHFSTLDLRPGNFSPRKCLNFQQNLPQDKTEGNNKRS